MLVFWFPRAFVCFSSPDAWCFFFCSPCLCVLFSSPDSWCFCFCSPRAMVSFLSSPDSWCFRFCSSSGFWCFCYFPALAFGAFVISLPPLCCSFLGAARGLLHAGRFLAPCVPFLLFRVCRWSSSARALGKKGHSFVLQKEHKERQNHLSKSLFIFRRRTWCPHELLLNHGPNWASG